MKTIIQRGMFVSGAMIALALSGRAQVVQLNAAINAAQETDGSASAATGTAVMLYNVASNTFSLTVTLNNFPNTLVSSGVVQGTAIASGTAENSLGSETASYVRSGNSLTATFSPVKYAGTPLSLLQRGVFLNFTTAAWPGGEVGGLLVAQPLKLVANVTSAQEIPATRTSGVSLAFGAADITYDPGLNMVISRISLFNFTNTLTVSHYHEDPPGVSGPVVLAFGGAVAYVQNGNTFNQLFTQVYTGNPITLLTNGSYVNFHSNIYPSGEIRGQVLVSTETLNTRIVNGSALGAAGSGTAPLTCGFVVTGAEPVTMLITARGPSLAQFGVANPLAAPTLSVFGGGVLMGSNTGWSSAFGASSISALVSLPLQTNDSALLLVFPPGAYTAQITTAAGASGTALIEVFDERANLGSLPGPTQLDISTARAAAANAIPELCPPGSTLSQ